MMLIIAGLLLWSFSGAAFYLSIAQSMHPSAAFVIFLLGLALMISGLKLMLMGLKDYMVSGIAAQLAEIKTSLKK